jgi:hypothetical protein
MVSYFQVVPYEPPLNMIDPFCLAVFQCNPRLDELPSKKGFMVY